MPASPFAPCVTVLDGPSHSAAEEAAKNAFAASDVSWVFAHPPPFHTLIVLLQRTLQEDARQHLH